MSSKSGDKRTYVWPLDCCQRHQNPETKGHMYGQKDMCPFSYWRAREGNSECIGKFHQSLETKEKKK